MDVLVWRPGEPAWVCAEWVRALVPARIARRPERQLPSRPAGTAGVTPNRALVLSAMDALEGRRLRAAGFCLLVLAVLTGLIVLSRVFGGVMAVLVAAQFQFGAALFCLAAARGGRVRVGMASAGFRRPIRAMVGCAVVLLTAVPHAAAGALLGLLLGAVVGTAWSVSTGSLDALTTSLALATIGGAAVFAGIAWLSTCLTFFVLLDHPDRPIFQAMRDSTQMMHGRRWKLFRLSLRFVGWLLAVPATLGLGIFYFPPLTGVTLALFYDDLRAPPEETGNAEPADASAADGA
jgi:uncharacterized membrane protein